MKDKDGRSWWSRFLRYFLDPIFYYLNLKESGKPSLSRLMLLGGFIHALATMSYITVQMFNQLAPKELRPAVSVAYLAFSGLCYSLIFGYRGFRLWLASKNGGLDTALNTEAANRSDVIRAEAAIINNRAIGAEQKVEFTE